MIYLIAGRGRSGKNTFASYIKEHLEKRGKKVCQIELMRTLKGYCKDYFGWDGKEETKPRDLLQQFGTEIIREKMNRPLFHIHRLTEDIEILSHFYDDFIVDDIRFPLEIEKIKEAFPNEKVIAISIARNSLEQNEMTEEQKQHITETALDGFDKYDQKIDNNDSLEELYKKAEQLVKEVDE